MLEQSYILQVYPNRIVVIGSVPINDMASLTEFAERLGFDVLTCRRNNQESFSFIKIEPKGGK